MEHAIYKVGTTVPSEELGLEHSSASKCSSSSKGGRPWVQLNVAAVNGPGYHNSGTLYGLADYLFAT